MLGLHSTTMRISTDIVDNYRTMFESRISAVRSGEFTMLGNLRFPMVETIVADSGFFRILRDEKVQKPPARLISSV